MLLLSFHPSQRLPQESMLAWYQDRAPSTAMSSPIPVGVFFNFLTLPRIRRRQTTSSSTDSDSQVIPNACYETCSGAFLEAQRRGQMAALCADGSTFSYLVDQCRQCIERFVNSSSSNSTASASSGNTTAELNEFIAYCDEQGGAAATAMTHSATATDDVTASRSSTLGPAATAGSGDRNSSSEGLNGAGTENLTSSGTSDISVIASAVIVPVVALLVGSGLACALIRQWRKRRGMEEIGAAGGGSDDKAQLHADEFRPELDGLAIAKKKVVNMDEDLAELPAREPIWTEMNGLGRTPSNLGMYNHDRLGASGRFFMITKRRKERMGSRANVPRLAQLGTQEQRDSSSGQLHKIGASGSGELYSDSLAKRCSCTVSHRIRPRGRRIHLSLSTPTLD
ncbi:hypothetical protein BDW67DRAFT_193983 [Aspergillus spinulosporus]